jgi:hypothetical protein
MILFVSCPVCSDIETNPNAYDAAVRAGAVIWANLENVSSTKRLLGKTSTCKTSIHKTSLEQKHLLSKTSSGTDGCGILTVCSNSLLWLGQVQRPMLGRWLYNFFESGAIYHTYITVHATL